MKWWIRILRDFLPKYPNFQKMKDEHHKLGDFSPNNGIPIINFEDININFIVCLQHTWRQHDYIFFRVYHILGSFFCTNAYCYQDFPKFIVRQSSWAFVSPQDSRTDSCVFFCFNYLCIGHYVWARQILIILY